MRLFVRPYAYSLAMLCAGLLIGRRAAAEDVIDVTGEAAAPPDGLLIPIDPYAEDLAQVTPHAGDAGGGGLPQFDPSTYSSQLVWLAIIFVALYLIMARKALPQVAEVLQARSAQREGNLNTAEKLRKETADVRKAYEAKLADAHSEARGLIHKAEDRLTEISARRQAEFAERAKTQITEAEKRITAAKKEALDSVADIAAETAAEALKKLAGTKISQADAKKATLAALKKREAA